MIHRLALAAALLSLPLSAAAQQRPTIGLGVGISPFAVPSAHAGVVSRTVEIYVPLAVGPTFRLEPSIGLATNDQPGGGVDTRDLTLGIGGFLVTRMAPTADMYAGARLKLNFARVEDGATGAENSGTDFQIAGAFGGEVYLVPRLSLGAEAELGLYQNSDASGDDSGWFTTGIAFLRVYFG
jgi:hypothetical protein